MHENKKWFEPKEVKKEADKAPETIIERIDDTKETVSKFMEKIDSAKVNGQEWVETTAEIIKHYNPRGLNGADFFVYNGIKVCEKGKIEAIEDAMNGQLGQRIHGIQEGLVENQ